MKTLEELRSMSTDELQSHLLVVRKEQFNLRTKKAVGSLEKTHFFPMLKKTVARIKTLITERTGVTKDDK